MRRIFVILFVCLSTLAYSQTATITGKVVDPSTSNQAINTKLQMELVGCSGNQPRYNGTALLWPVIKKYDTDASGNVSGTIYRSDSITCGTSTDSNKWRMTVIQNGQSSPPCDVRITASSFDATQPNCLNAQPTIAAPTDTTIWAKLDNTNGPFTGNLQSKTIENTRMADQFASIQAAIEDLGSAAGKVFIPCGTYNTTTAITASFDGLIIEGAGSSCVKIVYTGTTAITALLDLGHATQNHFNNSVSGISLYGNGAATLNASNGIRIRGVHHSQFSDIRARDVIDCGLITQFAVVDTFTNIRVSNNDENYVKAPQRGLCFDQRDTGERTTAGKVTDAEIASTTVAAADLVSADNMTFTGGEFQFTPIGIIVGRAADPTATWGNTFIGSDLEANTTEDMQINGYDTVIQNVISTGNTGLVPGIHIKSTAVRTTFVGGNIYANPSIKIDAGALYTHIGNVRLQTAISDAGTGTTQVSNGIVSASGTIPGSAVVGDVVVGSAAAAGNLWMGTDGNGFFRRISANVMLWRAGSGTANMYALDNNAATSVGFKTNGTLLKVRLGDDSADAPLMSSNFTASGAVSGKTFETATNCSSSGGTCATASAGSVSIAAAATTVTVATTAVTANSQIILTRDNSLGTKLSATCNTQSSLVLGAPYVSARTAGTSFTITLDVAPTTNPMCLSYTIVN